MSFWNACYGYSLYALLEGDSSKAAKEMEQWSESACYVLDFSSRVVHWNSGNDSFENGCCEGGFEHLGFRSFNYVGVRHVRSVSLLDASSHSRWKEQGEAPHSPDAWSGCCHRDFREWHP